MAGDRHCPGPAERPARNRPFSRGPSMGAFGQPYGKAADGSHSMGQIRDRNRAVDAQQKSIDVDRSQAIGPADESVNLLAYPRRAQDAGSEDRLQRATTLESLPYHANCCDPVSIHRSGASVDAETVTACGNAIQRVP